MSATHNLPGSTIGSQWSLILNIIAGHGRWHPPRHRPFSLRCYLPLPPPALPEKPETQGTFHSLSKLLSIIHPACLIKADGEHENERNKSWFITTPSSSPQQRPICSLLVIRSRVRFEGRRDSLWK